MAQTLDAIDISDNPELLRLVEEVLARNAPVLLRRGDEDLAILTPTTNGAAPDGRRVRTREDYEAFLRSAGSWADLVDGDQLIADIYASRGRPDQSPSDR